MQIKILSWNIWIDSNFEQVKEFLKNSDADIIGLQEVREDDPSRETVKYLNSLGYKGVFAPVAKTWGGKIWNDGPAVFTKHEIASTKKYILSEEDSRAAAQANIKIDDKILHVFSYTPNPYSSARLTNSAISSRGAPQAYAFGKVHLNGRFQRNT